MDSGSQVFWKGTARPGQWRLTRDRPRRLPRHPMIAPLLA